MLWLGKLYVWKWQKFRPFSNNLLGLFENGRKQTINHLVGILLENGRNFCRFLTTTTSCLKTAENKPSTILWGLCWKTAEISAIFQQLVFGHFPTTQNVSAVFQQRGFGRFPTIFFGRFPHPHSNPHMIFNTLSLSYYFYKYIFTLWSLWYPITPAWNVSGHLVCVRLR